MARPARQDESTSKMGLLSKSIDRLDDLFVRTLQDICDAEQQIAKKRPAIIEKASDPQLEQVVPQGVV